MPANRVSVFGGGSRRAVAPLRSRRRSRHAFEKKQNGPQDRILLDCPVSDFYRCPDGLVDYSVTRNLSGDPGYFRLGANAICYGQSLLPSPANFEAGHFPDSSASIAFDGRTVRLPFDPQQIIDNLRMERYTATGDAGMQMLSSKSMRALYYYFRPMLGIKVRRQLQRIFHRGWNEVRFPSWPVDTTVERVMETLLSASMKAQKMQKMPFIWFWPEGASSCAMVTHDVETKAGADYIPELMDIDEQYDVKASFQLIPEGPYSVSKALLNTIESSGFEVSVQDLGHDSDLFSNHEAFLVKAKAINQYLKEYGAGGFRAGRLYRNPDWYDALDIEYDMSVPNVAHLEPQRGGCCTVFPYFIGRCLELPLTTIQDYCLFHILGDYSIDLWKSQLELIMEKRGLASFIVHPDYIREPRALGQYKALLRYLSDLRDSRNVWVALPREVNAWWRQRSRMKLNYAGGGWRIEGEGSERARVGYAVQAGDRLEFTLAT
jgi:hypothetical protein